MFRTLRRGTSSLIGLASAVAGHPATKALRNDCSTICHLDQCHKTMLGPDALREYLEHVQLSGEALRPSLATLVTLHRQHAKNVPFSNITIAQGPTLLKELAISHEIPDISPDGLVKKLLRQKWGGYCFESNSLLAEALSGLGFEVYCVAGRNLIEDSHCKTRQQLIPSGFNHQIILARVPAMPDIWYVVDVAFGSRSPLEPIALREPDIAKTSDATHRLRRGFIGMAGTPSKQDLVDRPQACGWYMQRYSETDKEWQDLYVFNEANLALQRDFEVMNFYLAICEESIMRKDLIISVRNGYGGQGRDTLLNTTLKIFGENGMLAKDKELETVQDLRDALETHFGIIPD